MISKEEILRLAWLSRLELSEQEADAFAPQLESVIRYFDQLDRVPLEDLEKQIVRKPYSDMRADEPREFSADPFNTKYRKDRFIKGPRIS